MRLPPSRKRSRRAERQASRQSSSRPAPGWMCSRSRATSTYSRALGFTRSGSHAWAAARCYVPARVGPRDPVRSPNGARDGAPRWAEWSPGGGALHSRKRDNRAIMSARRFNADTPWVPRRSAGLRNSSVTTPRRESISNRLARSNFEATRRSRAAITLRHRRPTPLRWPTSSWP